MRLSLAARCALACALACTSLHGAAAEFAFSGELRALAEPRTANERGVLGEANAIAPRVAPPQRSSATLEAELRLQGHGLNANALLRNEQIEGGASQGGSRINELYYAGAVSAARAPGWHFSAGKKIVGWDVGYSWRPNDVVQQEERRTLVARTPEGRPLLQLEHFDADTALDLVWVNPTQPAVAGERRLGADEHAFAARLYRRAGAADWHGFARFGEHTHASVGAAVAWVATDTLELHASVRYAQRHDGWAIDPAAGGQAVTSNPWSTTTLGAASQWLVGFNWTNAQQFGVLAELWHDGAALADGDWQRWNERNRSLHAAASAPGLPAAARAGVAGNLAWQATPWSSANLRRDNLYLRFSWQHEAWQPALDVLYTPADQGRSVTASLAWQGDRWRIEGGLRQYGSPADAVMAQLPLRRSGYLVARYAF